jgi:hypothetical protein
MLLGCLLASGNAITSQAGLLMLTNGYRVRQRRKNIRKWGSLVVRKVLTKGGPIDITHKMLTL